MVFTFDEGTNRLVGRGKGTVSGWVESVEVINTQGQVGKYSNLHYEERESADDNGNDITEYTVNIDEIKNLVETVILPQGTTAIYG